MTVTEFKEQVLCYMPEETVYGAEEFVLPGDAKAEVDWRKEGILAPIKNQEQCGSCWAFSAVATLEAANSQKNGMAEDGAVEEFSEQQQVDCNKQCYGCSGGLPRYAFQFWQDNKGAATEKCYNYLGVDSTCRTDCDNKNVVPSKI